MHWRFFVACFFAFILFGSNASGQDHFPDSTKAQKGEGKVEIIQDERVDALIKKRIASNEAKPTIEGWRVQIKSFSGNNSKKEANDIKSTFLMKNPDMEAYIVYQAPNFKVRVGDFRTKLEASKFYRDIKYDFPSAFIVKDDINLPKMD